MKMIRRQLVVATAVLVIACSAAIVAYACGGDDKSSEDTTPAVTVAATLKDFALSLDKTSAPAGTIKFDVSNQGPSGHEFVILKTDLAPESLPVKDNAVDTSASDVKSIAEVEDIGAGASKSLTKRLDAGKYVLICNIVGHYQQGIHTAFTVD